jgi:hypothetical protein
MSRTAAVPAVVLVLVLLGIGYFRGPTLDASVFAVIGDGLRAGAVPYRDLFDHKPPGIYVAEALVGTALPFLDPWSRAWLLTAACSVGTLVVLGRALAPRFGTAASALGLLTSAPILGADLFALGGGYTEPVAILPATAGALLVLERGTRGRALAGGLLLGIAGIVSLQLAIAAGATVLLLLLRRRGSDALGVIAGGVAVTVVTAAIVAMSGAWDAAIDALVAYNRAYVASNSLLVGLPLVALARAAFVATSAGALALLRVLALRRIRPTDIEWLAIAWLLLGVAYVILQQNFFPHYLIAAAPAVVILASAGARGLAASVAPPRSRAGLVLPLVIVVLPSLLGVLVTERPLGRPEPLVTTAAAVSAATSPEDRIWVWGNEPELYLLTGRRPATRFAYLFPLVQPGYASPALVERTLADLAADPPTVIVDAANHPARVSFVALLKPYTKDGFVMADGGLLDPIRAWVRAEYVEIQADGPWTIYVWAGTV